MKGKLTEADWILRAMIAVAGADGRLNAREVRLIQEVYHDQTGRSVDVSGVVLAVEAYVAKRDVLTELSIAAGSMPQEPELESIASFHPIAEKALVFMVHETPFFALGGEERKRLEEIGAALQVSEGDLHNLLTKIESRSQ